MKTLLAFITATGLSYLFTFPTIWVAKKIKLVTDRNKRYHPAHTHQGIIPRGGGLPLILAFSITISLFLPINKIVVGVVLSSSLLVFTGLLDDYFDLSPYWRFLVNLIVAVIVISFGIGIPYLSNPFGETIKLNTWQIPIFFLGHHTIWVWADLLAIIWLSWTTNMVNWSKGVDGQLPGFVAIAAIFLGLLAYRFTAHDITVETISILCFIVAGIYAGFLPHNFYPQKIMPGYGGGALAGFLLGVLSILSFGKLGTIFLILAFPLIDAVYTILRRLKNKKSPFRADWGHFHHRLLEIGWGKRRIAVFYWTLTFILGIASLLSNQLEKVIIFSTIGALLLVFMLIIERMKKKS